jgi:hypothetical protein
MPALRPARPAPRPARRRPRSAGDVSSSASASASALAHWRVLRLQVGQALLGPLAAFDHVADALFEPAHLQRRLGQRALLQRAACRWRRSAPGAPSPARLRRGAARPGALPARWWPRRPAACTRSLPGGVAVLQEPQLVQLERALLLQLRGTRGHLGLLLQLVEVVVQLAQDVVDAGQVLARVLQPVLGLAAAFLVLADAGGFFQEQAQLFGPDSMMRLMVPWPMMA